jgi:hypothetical protein
MSNYQETRVAFRAERLKEGMTKNQAARAWESSPEKHELGRALREKEEEFAKEYNNSPLPDNYNHSTIPHFADFDDDDDPMWN